MRRAVLQALGAQTSYRYGVDTYDATKLGLGPLIFQQNGAANEDDYIGPAPISVARPFEQGTAIPSVFPQPIRWQNNTAAETDWIFLADNLAAAATRRINAYSVNRRTGAWTWKGFITITFPASTAKTIRGFRMTYDLITSAGSPDNTASVNGTAVTFSAPGHAKDDQACVGNRIGFGSTDPTQISQWYEIATITDNLNFTLTGNAGVIAAGPYVIEDLRAVMSTTDSTTTSGGVFLCKGLNWDAFTNIGGTVPAATTVDNIRACYWLADAATVLNTVSCGLGIVAKTSPISQLVYVLDTVANPLCYVYDIRRPMVGSPGLVAGKVSGDNLVTKTGAGGATTGSLLQANNGLVASLAHGPHNGVPTLYFVTPTRVYAAPVSGIITASTTWLTAGTVMSEVPPGSTNTFGATSLHNSVEYLDTIDKLIIPTLATTTPFRNYITQYRTDGGQYDRIWGIDTRQLDQVAVDSTTTPVPSQSGAGFSVGCVGGLVYCFGIGATALLNRGYALPLGADWEYAVTTGCRALLPKMTPTDINKYVLFFAQEAQVLGVGGDSGKNLGLGTEPWRMYFRTAGIDDNSGAWTLLDGSGYSSADGSVDAQLMLEWRTLGGDMLPARICNAGCIYDDLSASNYWQESVGKSSVAAAQFAYRQSVNYGTVIPRLRFRVYNGVTGGLLVDDDSTTQANTWEKSTDGAAWVAYNTTDRLNETTYVRVTLLSVSAVNARPLLTEY